MKTKYLPAVGATLGATFGTTLATLAGAATAQAQEPMQAQMQAQIEVSPQQPNDERDPLIRWSRGRADVRKMLQALDEACPQKILIGEGVGGSVEHTGRTLRLSEFLDTLSWAANLQWGYLDRDTIVVTRARPGRISAGSDPFLAPRPAPNLIDPRAPRTQITPRYRITPIPRAPLAPTNPLNPLNPDPRFEFGRRPDGVPENARPHVFNGQQYYIIPLQPGAHAEPGPSATPSSNEQPER